MADQDFGGLSVTNPNFRTYNQAFGDAISYAADLGVTSTEVLACIEIFPPDYDDRGTEYYSPVQFQRLLNCIVQKAVNAKTAYTLQQLNGLQAQVQQGVSDVSQQIQHALAVTGSDLGNLIDDIGQAIAESQYQLLQDQYLFSDSVRQFFAGAAVQFVQAVDRAVQAIEGTLKLIQVQNTNDVAALAETIRTTVVSQAAQNADVLAKFSASETQIADAIADLVDYLRKRDENPLAEEGRASGLSLISGLFSLFSGRTGTFEHDVSDPLAQMQAIARSLGAETPIAHSLFGASLPLNTILLTLNQLVAMPFVLIDILRAAMVPELNKLAQAYAYESRFQLMDKDEAITALYRGIISREELSAQLGSGGYPEPTIESLIKIYEKPIPIAELVSWWLRGLITDEQMEERFFSQGITAENTDLIKQAAFFIPPVGDLVTMAVREAFSPEIAATFGQYEDFPPDFARHAAKQGVSDEWAKAYWAAHWGLPSPNQGFDMFQRRIISREELEKLMKAQDIMPFWRDKMIQLAYNPLTRVDVRRMHLLGILDEEAVYNSYLDIGYSPDNAKALTEFTVIYNEEVADLGAARDIARDQIMQLYTQHIIGRNDAKSLLINLKYAEADAELLLTLQDVKTDSDFRKAQIELIKAKAKAGTLTFEQAQEQLSALNITPLELTNALADITNAKSQLTTLPSLTDLRAMYKNHLLSDDEFKRWLAALGYNEQWQARYIALDKGKANA